MGERKGFWSPRPRKGRDDAQLLAAEVLHDLRQAPYAELSRRADGEAETKEVTGLSGDAYTCRTTIRRSTAGGDEQLDILL
jgi:hypothetical protein